MTLFIKGLKEIEVKNILIGASLCALAFLSLNLYNLHSNQEKLIFRATPLPSNHSFSWETPFEEVFLEGKEEGMINGLLFKSATPPKGVILFFHGNLYNMGNLWGNRASFYTAKGYDLFMIDYRTFGKSRGKLSEKNLYSDAEAAYEFLQNRYREDQNTVYGLSLGTTFATHVASKKKPKQLILNAPFCSMIDMAVRKRPYLPRFILNQILQYPFRTDLAIQQVSCPINIFHGTNDTLIPHQCSEELQQLAYDKTTLHLLEGWGHEGVMFNPQYRSQIQQILP